MRSGKMDLVSMGIVSFLICIFVLWRAGDSGQAFGFFLVFILFLFGIGIVKVFFALIGSR